MLQLGLWAQLPLVLSTQGPSRSVQPGGLVEMLRSRQPGMRGVGQQGPVGLGDLFLIQSLPGVRTGDTSQLPALDQGQDGAFGPLQSGAGGQSQVTRPRVYGSS